jgi:hypothetical protein
MGRVYRKQIASDLAIQQLQGEVAKLSERIQINALLVEHCRRLMREKETMLEIIDANRFMAAALPRRLT